MPVVEMTQHKQDRPRRRAQRALCERDAAEYVGMSASWLKQTRAEGKRENRTPGPPYVKLGRSVRYLIEDLDTWLMKHRQDMIG